MDRESLRDECREIGRFNTGIADSVIDGHLNEAAIQFARDTHILNKNISFVVRETFIVGTDEAFNLTLATASGYIVNAKDVALATALTDVTGAAVATALQAIIQGTGVGGTATVVSYDTSTRKFTINASAEASVTSVTIVPPVAPATYYENAYKLFGVTVSDSASGSSYVGAAAPFCQAEYALPSNFLAVDEIIYSNEYDKPLQPEIYRWRSDSEGDPDFFSIYAKAGADYIRFTAHPQTLNTRMEMQYVYKPAAITTGSGNDSDSYPFNSSYDYALIFYAVYLTKLGGGPEDLQDAFKYMALYRQKVEEAEIDIWSQMGGGLDLSQRGRGGL